MILLAVKITTSTVTSTDTRHWYSFIATKSEKEIEVKEEEEEVVVVVLVVIVVVAVVVAVVVVVGAPPPYQPPPPYTPLTHIRFTRYLQYFRHVGTSYEA